jgi:cold shock CspA family protein
MSAWKAGEIQWFSDEFEEGMIVDTKDGEFYYLNLSAAKKLKELTKDNKQTKKVKFKLNTSRRSNQASDIKLDC